MGIPGILQIPLEILRILKRENEDKPRCALGYPMTNPSFKSLGATESVATHIALQRAHVYSPIVRTIAAGPLRFSEFQFKSPRVTNHRSLSSNHLPAAPPIVAAAPIRRLTRTSSTSDVLPMRGVMSLYEFSSVSMDGNLDFKKSLVLQKPQSKLETLHLQKHAIDTSQKHPKTASLSSMLLST